MLESLVQCAGLCMVRENASEDGERKPSLLYGLASGTTVATVLNPYEKSQNSVAAKLFWMLIALSRGTGTGPDTQLIKLQSKTRMRQATFTSLLG